MQSVVAPERTGWRDEALSRRHREWGVGCPMIDIDFLVVEYDYGVAKAMVEYKQTLAPQNYRSHPSYQALMGLANAGRVPFFACRYDLSLEIYVVSPLNEFAKKWTAFKQSFTELEYVRLIYRLRGKDVPADVIKTITARTTKEAA